MARARTFLQYDGGRVGRDHVGSRGQRFNLVCLPPAGSGLDFFSTVQKALPAEWSSDVLHPPGHLRTSGAPLEDVAAIADCFVNALSDQLSNAILFGHSLGAYVTYEIAARLLERKVRVQGVVLSGSIPPALGDPEFRPSTWREEDLIAWFAALGGVAAAHLQQIFPCVSEMVRADLRAFEGYRNLSVERLPLRSLILVGREDASCPVQDAAQWTKHFEHSELRIFPGAHDFVRPAASAVVRALVEFAGSSQPTSNAGQERAVGA